MKQEYYQVLITMREIEPPVWRRLLIPTGITFYRFHKIIQAAFGWQDYHLFCFELEDREICIPDDEYPHPLPQHNAKRVKIDEVLPGKPEMAYAYDFGDGWEHQVIVEGTEVLVVEKPIAFCLAGARCRPPEDVGGVGGYYDFLEIIADAKHDEYDDMLAWAEKDTGGRKYDPEYFYLPEVNRALAKVH